ncbi:MAG: 50S ribosomal protein L32 [Deltaproteobacteria bacterium]|nr:50S ribosomal protein L32 [Deltaproteobacteria bacterium]
MAVPKHKTSKSKRNMRRAHQKIDAANVMACPKCGEYKLPHNACPECGEYNGRVVIEKNEE